MASQVQISNKSISSMKSIYIGTKFDGHDSAVFLIDQSTQKLFGLSTERITRRKHDTMFPIAALERLIGYSSIEPGEISRVLFANSFTSDQHTQYPLGKYARDTDERRRKPAWHSSVLSDVPPITDQPSEPGAGQLTSASGVEKVNPLDATESLHECMTKNLKRLFPNSLVSVWHHDHEYCHALSSFFFSEFAEALVITMDGLGDEGNFSRAYVANTNTFHQISQSHSTQRLFDLNDSGSSFSKPCTIGGIYSFFTHRLGFTANCDEGKVEALAAYGRVEPAIYQALLDSVIVGDSIEVDFLRVRVALDNPLLRFPQSIDEKSDLAATVQQFTEDIVLRYIKRLVEKTGIGSLCLSGGIFANVILNMKIARDISPALYIVPAVGDDGSAQGAAVAELIRDGYSHRELDWLRKDFMPYYGTSYSRAQVLEVLRSAAYQITFEEAIEDWPEQVADLVYTGAVGAIFHGRMEWGPRALGNRSILISPTRSDAKDVVNSRVKRRHFFQPVCPAILLSEKERLFDFAYPNKHMTCAFPMKANYLHQLPGAVHIDGTARVQFVEQADNPYFFRVLNRLKEISGFGVVLNTSFNMHGRTIVESPDDAIVDFLDMNLDFLVMEGYLIRRA